MSLSRAHRSPRSSRPLALVTLAALVAALFTALVLPAGAAHAASYRFWGYYHLHQGTWQFAQKGPDQVTPKNGSVEGWRFALADQSTPRFPRATPSFQDICGSTTAATGKKRVAVVLDFGRPVDGGAGAKPPAPKADCAVVDSAASGAEVLAAVAQVRSDKGLICGVDGYPQSGCGGEVKSVPAAAKAPDKKVTLAPASTTPTASASASTTQAAGGQSTKAAGSNTSTSQTSSSSSGSSTATWVGSAIAILIVAALAVVTLQRRRRD
ncbi:MAG TPA: SCO2322 family protein [Segeticoccus sp.]|uniref:SCO2322 family protein n=1 Tax=Segeticoccus sp. TaxID=2706531 RepID=UPI002D7F3E90|nr:SCO2322 family protein [Segeticoccus sp.]HET8600356.1 SCO2322 family protein [Segeticoccus sp.]